MELVEHTDAHVEELNKIGIKCWDWDVDSLDWESKATINSIMENIEYCMKLFGTIQPIRWYCSMKKILQLKYYQRLFNIMKI